MALLDYKDESEVYPYFPESYTRVSDGTVLPFFDDAGRLICANMPVKVPPNYIKTADYQGDEEIFTCMGLPALIDGLRVMPPSLGVWSLLESFDCPFVNEFNPQIDLIHCLRALYINEHREKCAAEVYEWRFEGIDEFTFDDESTWATWDEKVMKWGLPLDFKVNDFELWLKIRIFFDMSFNGYSMMPGGSGGSEYLFGAETIGAVIATAAPGLSTSLSSLLWDTPMLLLGHTAAATARNNGQTGISRAKDPSDIKKQLILAAAREYKGELHPWQRDEPLRRRLTKIQDGHPALVQEFDELVNAAAKKAGLVPGEKN